MPEQAAAEPPVLKRELRLALAMRGGVSLAVWIGGAVAEIDELRLASLKQGLHLPRRRLYKQLLEDAGYERVAVDVLGGASAGGLNAVIYGFAQSVGLTLGWLERVWLDKGGLWDLLRPSGPALGVPSFLRGDDYFFAMVRDQLLVAATLPSSAPPADQVTVDLAATLRDADQLDLVTPVSDRITVERSSAVHFHFRRRQAPLGSVWTDIPGPDDVLPGDSNGPYTTAVARLALAARSTSSYPGAFEPAAIMTDGTPPASVSPALPVMGGVFSESGGKQPFRVIDGGVFDNIPIARTLEAIEGSPADGPTKRVLIYLDPSPPPTVVSPLAPRAVDRFLPTVLRSLSLKQRQETAEDDVSRIRARNDEELLARGRQELLAGVLQGSQPMAGDTLVSRYAGYRGTADATRLARLCTDPAKTFLRTAVTAGYIPALTEVAALDLKAAVVSAYEDGGFGGSLLSDVTALIDAATMLISWIRALEREDGPLSSPVPDGLKGRLYRIRRIAQHIRDECDYGFAETFLSMSRPDAGTPGLVAPLLQEHLARQAGFQAADLPLDADELPFWTWLDGTFAHQDMALPLSLVASLWDAVGAVRDALVPIQPAAGSEFWTESIFALVLRVAPYAGLPVPRVSAILAASGAPAGGAEMIDFVRITGDEAPAVPLPDVLEDARRRAVTGLVQRGSQDELLAQADLLQQTVAVGAGAKLAGNQLANFAGFADAGWRGHDWRWGRADGAAGLVRLLRREIASKQGEDPGSPAWSAKTEELVAQAQHEILRSPDASHPGPNRPKPSLADLRPSFRFAVASRMAHLLPRVLWPEDLKSWGSRLQAAALLLVLRPLLCLVPLVTRPLSLLCATAALMGLVAPLPNSNRAAWLAGALLGVSSLVLLVTAVRAVSAARRWRHVRTMWPEDGVPALAVRRVTGSVFVAGFASAGAVLLAAAVVRWTGSPKQQWLQKVRPVVHALQETSERVHLVAAAVLVVGLVVGAQASVTRLRTAPGLTVPRPWRALAVAGGEKLVTLVACAAAVVLAVPQLRELVTSSPVIAEHPLAERWRVVLVVVLVMALLHWPWACRLPALGACIAGGFVALAASAVLQWPALVIALLCIAYVTAVTSLLVPARGSVRTSWWRPPQP